MNIYEQAAKRIASGRRTEKELKDWLIVKGFDHTDVRKVLREFCADGYIDDYAYAVDFFRYAEGKCWGKARAYRELERKGIGSVTADEAYDEYAAESIGDEMQKAVKALKKASSLSDLDENGRLTEKARARYARRLFSYGFDTSTIYGAIEKIASELKEELYSGVL